MNREDDFIDGNNLSKENLEGASVACNSLISFFEYKDFMAKKSSYKRATQAAKELRAIVTLELEQLPPEKKPFPYRDLLNAFLAAGTGAIVMWIYMS